MGQAGRSSSESRLEPEICACDEHLQDINWALRAVATLLSDRMTMSDFGLPEMDDADGARITSFFFSLSFSLITCSITKSSQLVVP